jgi:nucleotide-binding universal stress UspA family protein
MLVSSSVARPTPKEMSMLESHFRGERSQPSSVTGDLLTLRNILITTDFSACSARALDHALESRVGTKRDCTCFIALMTIYNLVGPDAVQMACDAAWRDIQQLNADLSSKGLAKNVELKLLVEDGRLATILPEIVRRLDLRLIVVGTHGRTGWRKLVLGSVAEIVVRRASCPVFTVGPS